jgi:uncharacterized protein YbdZ (MbtH family)
MNCFDDPDGAFLALVNDEGQHSLWPDSLDVPAGWRVVEGPGTRDGCTAYIEDNWTVLRAGGSAAPASRRGDR